MLAVLKEHIGILRANRVTSRSRHAASVGHISPDLFECWQRTAHLEFPDIPKDRFFFANALAGLLEFFACVRDSDLPCGLPSSAADSVWHAWAARAPGNLERFCIDHFGRPIPHIDEADMKPQMESALATCMVRARRLEGRDPVKPSVPSLFALDRKLRMPRGYSYELRNGAVTLQRLDACGLPYGSRRCQGGLEVVQLLSAGLISQHIYDRHQKAQDGGAGACDSSASGSSASGAGDCSSLSCDSGGGGGGCGAS